MDPNSRSSSDDVESIVQLAVAAFGDDPLNAALWPLSLRVGKEDVAIEERVGRLHDVMTRDMEDSSGQPHSIPTSSWMTTAIKQADRPCHEFPERLDGG